MIAKKNPKKDLERKRFAFFQIGLIVSGSLCLAAFEYSSVHSEERMVQRLEEPTSIFSPPIEYEKSYIQPKQEKRSTIIKMDDELDLIDHDPVEGETPEVTIDKIVIGEGDGKIGGTDFTFVELDDNEIHPISQESPAFPGGDGAMAKFISNNIRLPEFMGDQGTVYVDFVVNKDGSIEQVSIAKGVSQAIDKAAMDVVAKMPKWKPGINAGKPVRVRYTVPIKVIYE